MKHNYFKHLFTALLLLCTTVATAYDFKADGFIFNITDSVNKTVEIAAKIRGVHYTNDIVIPEEVTFKDVTYSVTGIGERAFDSCTGLTSITIPNSVTSIGYQAFNGCTGLTSIEIPNSVTSIGNEAFAYCTGLTSITIPNSVTSIGNQAFIGCTGLTSIEIPSSVTSIGESTFYGCTGLTSIEIPNSVTSIEYRAFSRCTGLEKITVASDNEMYDSRNHCNAIIETATNTLVVGCKNTTIPADIKAIGSGAFHHCKGLTSIIIPNSVTSIGNDAFLGCI